MRMMTRYRLFRGCGRDSLDALLDANHRALVYSLVILIAITFIEACMLLRVR